MIFSIKKEVTPLPGRQEPPIGEWAKQVGMKIKAGDSYSVKGM
jgi:hypothetical protein